MAILQLISAILIGIGGLVGAIYMSSWGGTFGDKIIIALAGLAATFFLVIFSLAFAELLKLLIDIEHNTRMMAVPNNGSARAGQEAAPMGGHRGTAFAGEETAEGALLRGH
jgi:hypothetical protein